MKKFISAILVTLVFIIFFGCGSTVSQLNMQEPEEGKCIVVGAVLLENNGVDDIYDVRNSNITVIIVGKSIKNGEEIIEGYRVKTDENGYFYLPNVPKGAFVLKGLEVSIGYRGLTLITSRWDGTRQIFHTASNMIDYVVRSWPEESMECVNDMEINYLMIDPSMGIYSNRYPELKGNVLALTDVTHTMTNPEVYYQEKYPEIKCLAK